MTQQEIQELAGHRQVPAWVVKLVGDCLAKEREQEPVAYWNFNSGFSHCMIDQLNEAAKHNPAPLYTHPQPKENT